MNYIEAIRELKAGKKIKLKSWIKGNYWQEGKGGQIRQIIYNQKQPLQQQILLI